MKNFLWCCRRKAKEAQWIGSAVSQRQVRMTKITYLLVSPVFLLLEKNGLNGLSKNSVHWEAKQTKMTSKNKSCIFR